MGVADPLAVGLGGQLGEVDGGGGFYGVVD